MGTHFQKKHGSLNQSVHEILKQSLYCVKFLISKNYLPIPWTEGRKVINTETRHVL